ncbi:DAK2 domain-containing protein [Actinoplanes sp. CA-051413]|uniref:DAK2 domain-containing protein n=1 Tax=Actinoplanes sp. CA-051413 TaxID=3239899 RepID=UPI003D996E3E
MLDSLDAAAVRRWCGGGLAALRAHQHEIDELNVYPVPDGDTGTNLVLTLTSAQQALDDAPDQQPTAGSTALGGTMRLMARGALLGARGNSGVIVSQILRGMADTFATAVAVRGGELTRALRTASEAAYAAVAKPVEGTVLSVVAAAAEGARKTASDDLVAVARAAARAAAEALARTPQQLPILARAGVVDAGGRGLVLLLEALVEALNNTGPSPSPMPAGSIAGLPAPKDPPLRTDGAVVGLDEIGSSDSDPGGHEDLGYEVQYLLDAAPESVESLRGALGEMGDSLVIVGTGDGDPPTWNVHVHVAVADVGAAIEAGVVAGRPYRITVTHLEDHRHESTHPPNAQSPHTQPSHTRPEGGRPASDQATSDRSKISQHGNAGPDHNRRNEDRRAQDRHESNWLTIGRPEDSSKEQPLGPDASDPDARATVVVAAGDGLTAIFAAEGATVVGRNPSTAEMLAAIASTGAGHIVLLPNDANTHAVARSAAQEAAADGVRVSVVPTRSPVQALAALAVRDPGRPFDDDVIAMAEAAGACRYGEVCTASREALTVAGRCHPGDLLGLVDGEVHVIGDDLEQVCLRLLDRLLGGGGELVTLVLGADAPPELEERLRAHVTSEWRFVELNSYAGGQPRYHLLVGVE